MKHEYPFLTKLVAAVSLALTMIACKVEPEQAASATSTQVESLTLADPSQSQDTPPPVDENPDDTKNPKEVEDPEDVVVETDSDKVIDCITNEITSETLDVGYTIKVSKDKDNKYLGNVRAVNGREPTKEVYDGEVKLQKVSGEKCSILVTDIKDESRLKIRLIPNEEDELDSLDDARFKQLIGKFLPLECKADQNVLDICG